MTARRDHRLLDWLAEQLSWPSNEAAVERIGEGHSREMLIVRPARASPVVVRLEQDGVFGTTGVEECRVMAGLRERNVPTARVLATDGGATLGRPFFVMEFIEGSSGHFPIDGFVESLHALHRLDVDDEVRSLFDEQPLSAAEATLGQIDRWDALYRHSTTGRIEVLEAARQWLGSNVPSDGRLAVVHGDAGPGNIVHDGQRVLAITDWEFAHLGDPREDWSFCVAVRGARTLGRETWLALIEDRTGMRFDDESWRYWEAFNLFKGACANLTCRLLYETGRNPAPNMAIIGTALHRLFAQRLAALIP
ncbi:MAG: phosphotransferase [Ilumatobacteraceae bacterium]